MKGGEIMDFKWHGDELIKKINEKFSNITEDELFTPSFMRRFTKFDSFKEFILNSGLIDLNEEDINEAIKAISKKKLDEYIRKNTNNNFNSWENLLKRATNEFLKTFNI